MDNIFFSVTENEDNNNDNPCIDINSLLNDYSSLNKNNIMNEDIIISKTVDYTLNYTVKELMAICDYYGIAKELKQNKCNKDLIVHNLIIFELNQNNYEIVFKRQNLWFYMNELKKDKFMKKYIIW